MKFKNVFYYCLGGIFIFLNKIRYSIEGYKTPRPFSIKESDKCIDYDFNTVDGWLNELNNLIDSTFSIKGKRVLELGPGADLGVGLILLARGAMKYSAIDVNPLVYKVPKVFYDALFDEIAKRIPLANINDLKYQLQLFYEGKSDRLNYICDKNFSFSSLQTEMFDVVFSQAAFEHFDDIENTLKNVTEIVSDEGLLLLGIDFQTHTRWIRERDPLNIYRYSDKVYKLFSFQGIPNRLRPDYYIRCLEKSGWKDIKFVPKKRLSQKELEIIRPYLYGRFSSCENIDILNGILFARRCS